MANDTPEYLTGISDYYSSRILQYGQTPEGVDWNGRHSQTLRFEQLCRILSRSKEFSVNDLGCGYGALLDHLSLDYSKFSYFGFDISTEMIEAARNAHIDFPNAQFLTSNAPRRTSDYGIASGIFNVRLNNSIDDWELYVFDALKLMNSTSEKGFAFNCLTSFSDTGKMKDHLYYADPCKFFNFCKKEFSKNVALLHDYDLYEFTILVKKL